jgi:hypothetical protein
MIASRRIRAIILLLAVLLTTVAVLAFSRGIYLATVPRLAREYREAGKLIDALREQFPNLDFFLDSPSKDLVVVCFCCVSGATPSPDTCEEVRRWVRGNKGALRIQSGISITVTDGRGVPVCEFRE